MGAKQLGMGAKRLGMGSVKQEQRSCVGENSDVEPKISTPALGRISIPIISMVADEFLLTKNLHMWFVAPQSRLTNRCLGK